MKLGSRIINRVIWLSIEKDKVMDAHKIILPFYQSPEDLDLRTICKLEVLLDEKLLIIPTKIQWRKIKLDRLNKICKRTKNEK